MPHGIIIFVIKSSFSESPAMQSLLDQIIRFSDNPLLLFIMIFALAVANLFFPPIPLETLTLMAGYLSGTGRASLWAIISATTSGMFCGSLILYYISRRYHNTVISGTPLRKFFTKNSYLRAVGWFKKYGLWTVFLGKLVPGMSFLRHRLLWHLQTSGPKSPGRLLQQQSDLLYSSSYSR